MEHEIRKLVVVYTLVYRVVSGGVGGYTFKALGLDRKHEWDCMTRIRAEREDTAEVMATRHGGFEIKQRKAPENMIAWINSSPVLKPLFVSTSSCRGSRCNKNPAEHNENFCNFFSRTTAFSEQSIFTQHSQKCQKFLSRKNFSSITRDRNHPENFHWKCGRIHRASLIWFRLVCCVPLVVCLHRTFGKVKSCVILISRFPTKFVSGVNTRVCDPVSNESVNPGKHSMRIKFKGWCVGVVFLSADIKVCSFWITKSLFTTGVKQHCLPKWFVKVIRRNVYAMDFCCELIIKLDVLFTFLILFPCPRWSRKLSRESD